MSLSIVIVNWNSKDYLRKCLESLAGRRELLDLQVIVVDGGSFDGCDEMLGEHFPWVEFVQVRGNVGFGASNNIGFERVDRPNLLLLNPDTEVHGDALERLLATLEEAPDAGIVGARLLNSDGSLQMTSLHLLPRPLNFALDSAGSRLGWWRRRGYLDARGALEAEGISGACMMMKSETFGRLGGFAGDYFMYAEDMDLSLGARRLGLKNYYEPRAEITHHGGGSSGGAFSRFSVVMIREALWTYMRRNHGLATALAFRGAQAVSALVRLPLLAVAALAGRGGWNPVGKWWTVLRWAAGTEGWARKTIEEGLDDARRELGAPRPVPAGS